MCHLDLFNSAPVIVTLASRRSINSPPPPSLCPLLHLFALCRQGGAVFHTTNQLKTLSCALVPVMSVRLCSFISLSVRLAVRLSSVRSLSVHLSVCLRLSISVCPSLSLHLSSVRLSLCPSVSLRLCPSVICPCFSPSVCHLSVRLSLCSSLSVRLRS